MKKFVAMMMALMMLLCSVSAMAEMAGGWTIPEDTFPSNEAFDAFTGAVGNDTDLLPAAVLGTQVVAGMNYMMLCRVATVTAEPTEHWALAVVYVDLENKASVSEMQDVELSLNAD